MYPLLMNFSHYVINLFQKRKKGKFTICGFSQFYSFDALPGFNLSVATVLWSSHLFTVETRLTPPTRHLIMY